MREQNSIRTGIESIMDGSEVAEKYAEYLEGTDISISDNVVTPQLLQALKQKGIPIEMTGKIKDAEEVKNSVRELPDGTKYVEADTDQDIFKGINNNPSKIRKVAAEYIRKMFQGKNLHEGITITSKGRDEYLHVKMTNDKYIPKLKASTEINNLIEAGEYITHLQDSGRHEEAVNGWDYYNVIYHVGNRWFNGLTNIMKTENEDRFYDITKIREIDPRPGSNAGLGEESSLIADNI